MGFDQGTYDAASGASHRARQAQETADRALRQLAWHLRVDHSLTIKETVERTGLRYGEVMHMGKVLPERADT